MNTKSIIVIPARMASTRFPNKPMAKICGTSMIERVWKIAMAVPEADAVVIATDDRSLKDFAENFGAQVVMTSSSCLTGTDRVAEVATLFNDRYDIFFNLQGDAVLTPPWIISDLLNVMQQNATILMATPAVHLTGDALKSFIEKKQKGSSSGTSVTFNKQGDALYFSKGLIPFQRNSQEGDRTIYQHIGLYGYRAALLQRLSALPEGEFEKCEKLEQLRTLENGIPIRIVQVDFRGRTQGSVDNPEDVAFVESIIYREGELV